jgi:hypothetical protein
MKIHISPYLIPAIWIVSALCIYFPSQYFPYQRDSSATLAVVIVTITAITSSALAYFFDIRSRLLVRNTKSIFYRKSYRFLVWFVIGYILIFDFVGLYYFSESVFSSKKFLDSASFIKSPINFKLFSGFLIGYFLYRLRREFLVHALASALFSFLFAERLHLMEFLIAFGVGFLCRRQVSVSLIRIAQLAIGFVCVFIGFEATRNFYVLYFVKGSGISLLDAFWNLTERFAAYYGDTTNKFAVVLSNTETSFVPFHYVLWLKTQIFKDNSWFSGISIGDLADSQGASFENLTNIGTFALLYSDFGIISIFLCVILGVLPSYLFLKFHSNPSIIMGVLLTIFIINALEFTRIFYLFNLRGWMSLLPIFILIFLRGVSKRV